MRFLTVGVGAVSNSVPALHPLLLAGLNDLASIEQGVFSPTETRSPRIGWYPRESSALWVRRGGSNEKEAS